MGRRPADGREILGSLRERDLNMDRRTCLRVFTVAPLSLLLSPKESLAEGTRIDFPSLDDGHPYRVSGQLYLPARASSPSPAVVMVHGTTGIDPRGALYRQAFTDIGIAVFEVDFKTGVYTGPMDRPSPDALLAMGFAALRALRKRPAVDARRIGILGFSMGGHLAINTAFERSRKTWLGDEKGFAAHVGYYPVCKAFLMQSDVAVTGAPMLILYGSEDVYGDGENVPRLKERLKREAKFDLLTVEYAGAAHGFDRNAPPLSYRDPAAKGGRGYMAWNPEATADALKRTVAFLRQNLVAG